MTSIRTTKVAAAATAALIAAAAGYWYFSPYLVMRTMRTAAIEKDVETINDHVDYARLRESVKGQFIAIMAHSMKELEGNPFAALGASMGMMMVNGLVAAVVRPEVLMATVQSGKMDEATTIARPSTDPASAATAAKIGPGPTANAQPSWRVDRRSVNRMIVHAVDQSELAGLGLVFERFGFATWKITELRLPADVQSILRGQQAPAVSSDTDAKIKELEEELAHGKTDEEQRKMDELFGKPAR